MATEDWGTVTTWGIWDRSVVGGTMYYYGTFDVAKAINSGDTLEIATGDFIVEER